MKMCCVGRMEGEVQLTFDFKENYFQEAGYRWIVFLRH